MKKTSTFVLLVAITLASLASLASCKKKKAIIAADESTPLVKKAVKAAAASYDYSQPMETILRDAGVQNPIVAPYVGIAKKGTFLFEYQGKVACNPEGPVCEIVVFEQQKNQVNSAGNSTIISGSAENPIGVVQAFPEGPVYRQASKVTYTETDEEITIDHTYLP